jgi:hypothetical protein
MKVEMFELAFRFATGHDYETFTLGMKAPSGEIVLDPKRPKPTRMERYHARHFPNSMYDFGRNIQTSGGTNIRPLVVGAYAAAGVYAVSLPFLMATSTYPQVSGPQFQSSISGQPSGSDPNLLFGGKQGLDYFLKNFR